MLRRDYAAARSGTRRIDAGKAKMDRDMACRRVSLRNAGRPVLGLQHRCLQQDGGQDDAEGIVGVASKNAANHRNVAHGTIVPNPHGEHPAPRSGHQSGGSVPPRINGRQYSPLRMAVNSPICSTLQISYCSNTSGQNQSQFGTGSWRSFSTLEKNRGYLRKSSSAFPVSALRIANRTLRGIALRFPKPPRTISSSIAAF